MLLTIFGLGMLALGVIMLVKSLHFAQGVFDFSDKPWFHVFEITSRLIAGLLFLWQSEFSDWPVLYWILGGVLGFTSVFLVVIGPLRHQHFAKLTAQIGKGFRPIGIFAISIACLLIYAGLMEFGL